MQCIAEKRRLGELHGWLFSQSSCGLGSPEAQGHPLSRARVGPIFVMGAKGKRDEEGQATKDTGWGHELSLGTRVYERAVIENTLDISVSRKLIEQILIWQGANSAWFKFLSISSCFVTTIFEIIVEFICTV